MSSPKNLKRDNGLSKSAELPCDSPVREVREFENAKISKYYPRGAVLFVEGQRPHGVYKLCEGRAKVSISSKEGKTLVLRIAQPGDLLGLNSALTGRPYDATVATMANCRVDFISRADFTKVLDGSSAARDRVSQALGDELSEVIERARAVLLSQSSAEKLARLLLEWCDEFGKPTPEGIRLNHGFTQEEIAQIICTSRETVSRLLTELKRKQIVRLNGTGIFVRDRVGLELIAQT